MVLGLGSYARQAAENAPAGFKASSGSGRLVSPAKLSSRARAWLPLKNWIGICGAAALTAAGFLAGAGAQEGPPAMLLPGQFDVTASGAATYTIPIAVPPGTSGMSPVLSIDYSSQGGDGLLGLGFSLSGLPVITRCPRTVAQDGVKGSVNYDANDRFCLEGQRLTAISGTYGANNTEYRTELEGFSKIVSYGTAGTGPAWFKVWTKSGQIMEFGNTADSRIEAQGKTTARLWAVNKITDTKGNYLTATYTETTANGEFRPSRIDYTGNAGAGLSPYNSVQFTYNTSRPDQVPLYHAGSLIKTTALLTNVKTYAGTTLVSDYRIAYEFGSNLNRSRVTSVTLCDGATTPNCLPPTTFGWQGTRDTIATSTLSQSIALPASPGDVNGDGLTDYRYNTSIFAGTLAGTFTPLYMEMCDDPLDNYEDTVLVDVTGDTYSDFPYMHVEIEGGGGGDAYLAPRFGSGGIVRVSADIEFGGIQNIQGFATVYDGFCLNDRAGGLLRSAYSTSAVKRYADLNGDGKTEIIRYTSAFTFTGIVAGEGAFGSMGSFSLGEIVDGDGDGCADRYYQNTVTFSTYCPAAIASFTVPNWSTYGVVLGDFNGDGITDYLKVHMTQAGSLHLGTGSGVVSQSFSVPVGWRKYAIYPADYNGDGRSDIALVAPGGAGYYGVGTSHEIWLSTGTGFVQAVTIGNSNPLDSSNVQGAPGDWNNNGASDLWITKPSGGVIYNITFTPELVSTITSGLGIVTTFTYDRLNKGSPLYVKDTDGTYPKYDLIGPYYVVAQVDSADGIGGTYSSSYTYAGAKGEHQGRGFLGFRQRTVKDLETGIEQTTTFRQDWPYIGLASLEEKRLGAQVLNRVTNTFGASDLGSGRRFVYLQQTLEESFDLNGAIIPAVTTSYVYDAYGNPTEITVATPDGASKVTTNVYTNDTANWFLGRLTSSSVTSTVP